VEDEGNVYGAIVGAELQWWLVVGVMLAGFQLAGFNGWQAPSVYFKSFMKIIRAWLSDDAGTAIGRNITQDDFVVPIVKRKDVNPGAERRNQMVVMQAGMSRIEVPD